jgi:hypothetical protein
LEESEAELGEHLASIVPADQEAALTAPRTAGASTSSEVAGAMLLGKFYF